MTDANDVPPAPPARRRGPGNRIPETIEADIQHRIQIGDSDQTSATACGVSQPTVAIRRARVSAPPDLSGVTPLVIGALRHLAASDGLTIANMTDRLGITDATPLVHALITLGVVRRTIGDPPRYGLRKDWL